MTNTDLTIANNIISSDEDNLVYLGADEKIKVSNSILNTKLNTSEFNSFVENLENGVIGDNYISSNLMLNVPNQYNSISDALNSIINKIILDGVTVTIQVADGNYTQSGYIYLNHPYGDKIQIIGNTTNPASCKFTFAQGGWIVSNNNQIKLINGFTLESTDWTSHGQWAYRSNTALSVINGAIVNVGSNMRINKSYYGLRAADGGKIFCNSDIQITESGDGGVFAFGSGSVIYFKNCSSTLASDTLNGLGFGIISENNAWVWADGSTASNNAISGFFANTGGAMWAKSATANYNSRHGFECERGSKMEINNSIANNNGVFGAWAGWLSYVLKNGLSGSSNGSGLTGYRPTVGILE